VVYCIQEEGMEYIIGTSILAVAAIIIGEIANMSRPG
jgi:hypothetical protein